MSLLNLCRYLVSAIRNELVYVVFTQCTVASQVIQEVLYVDTVIEKLFVAKIPYEVM